MYCKLINAFRKNITDGVAIPVSQNYYTPTENCSASVGGKNLCGICGEKSKWTKNHQLKTHSTKCCPYRYHFNISNRKEFVDALEEGIDEMKNDFENTLNQAEVQIDKQTADIVGLQNEIVLSEANYEKEQEKTALFSNLFGEVEINRRKVSKEKADEDLANVRKEFHNIKLEVVEATAVISKDKVLWEMSRGKMKKLQNELKRSLENTVIQKKRELDLVNHISDVEEENKKLWDCISNKKSDKEKCPICIEYIIDNGCKTECGHHYHTKCYSEYICNKMNNLSYGKIECCICRATIFEKTY